MTAPTIGRVVYYRPSQLEVSTQRITQIDPTEPFRADVVFVNSDAATVNLVVHDHLGERLLREDIDFYETQQDTGAAHAHWMPYQVAQAAKADPTPPAQPAPSPTEPPAVA